MAHNNFQPKFIYGRPNPNYSGPEKASSLGSEDLGYIGSSDGFVSSYGQDDSHTPSQEELNEFSSNMWNDHEDYINEELGSNDFNDDYGSSYFESYPDEVKGEFNAVIQDMHSDFKDADGDKEIIKEHIADAASQTMSNLRGINGYDDDEYDRADALNDDRWLGI